MDNREPHSQEYPPDPVPDVDYVPLPGVRRLTPFAALRWVAAGWADFRQAPAISLSYGGFLVLVSYAVTAAVAASGNTVLLFSLLTGFMFMAPLLALALYDVSRELESGTRPQFAHGFGAVRRVLGSELVFAGVLLIVLLVWARAAAFIHVFFPATASPHWQDWVAFLGIGSVVGAAFAVLVFGVSAFSLPLIMDRDLDVISSVITSLKAVSNNKPAMIVWAAVIVASVALGFATAFVGLAITMPVIGYATWHAYRETIEPMH